MGKRREHRGIVNTERDEGQGWSSRGKRVGMRNYREQWWVEGTEAATEHSDRELVYVRYTRKSPEKEESQMGA